MEKIQIKCTSCGQKFAVSESYKGKMVECGACDHRFKVEGPALLRKKRKYYPGEKAALNPSEFHKSTDKAVGDRDMPKSTKFQPANYAEKPHNDYITPARPRRTMAISIGIVLIIMAILLFLLGGRSQGALQDIDDTKRLLLAAFVSLLGSGLIIYGFRNKGRGILLSLVLSAGLMSMPSIFPETLTPQRSSDTDALGSDTDQAKPASADETEEAYTTGIGYADVIRLRKEATKLKKDPAVVKAIVLKDVGAHIDTILFYIKNKLQLDIVPSTYTLGRELEGRPVTLVIFESEISTEALVELTKRFGSPEPMNALRSEIGVIEVGVENKKFANIPVQILNDEDNPSYFNANYIELNSMNRKKQMDAIKRLNKTTISLGRRNDIAKRLSTLISTHDQDLSSEAIKTLNKWSLPAYNLDSVVLDYAKELSPTENLDAPVMDYLVDKQIQGSSTVLAEQWLRPQGYLRWEDQLVRAKSIGEKAIIEALPKAPESHIKSGAAILRKIGTAKSLPVLRATAARLETENANYLKATIDEIKSRQ